MLFCLQSWKEVIVRTFVSKSKYFWSQTSLIAPKESMMGTKSRVQGSDGPGGLPLYTLWRCAVKPLLDKPYADSMCLLYIEQNECTSSVHTSWFLNLPSSFIVNGGDTTSWSENRLLREGKKQRFNLLVALQSMTAYKFLYSRAIAFKFHGVKAIKKNSLKRLQMCVD